MESNSSNPESSKPQLPPLPHAIYEWSDFDKDHFLFKGDKVDIQERMKFKIYNLWTVYGELCTNQKLVDYINKKEHNKTGEKFYLKNLIVNLVDRLSKILINTDLIEELSYCADTCSKDVQSSCGSGTESIDSGLM